MDVNVEKEGRKNRWVRLFDISPNLDIFDRAGAPSNLVTLQLREGV